jgi:hypothetical protein
MAVDNTRRRNGGRSGRAPASLEARSQPVAQPGRSPETEQPLEAFLQPETIKAIFAFHQKLGQ